MNSIFQRLMQKATALTRKGDLVAATAAIQDALNGKAGAAPTAEHETKDDIVIDVVAREVSEPASDVNYVEPAQQESFIRGTYRNASDQRDYKLYVPPVSGDGPVPLVVMLHGCKQHADDFAAGTAMNDLARAQGFFVLYPEQSQQANPQRCWNWFKHSHQVRERGEPALVAGMTREVMAQYAIDPSRVYVAGLSAGGAMAAIVGDAYPDLFAAVGVHSGLPAGAAKDLPSAFGAMQGGPKVVARTEASGIPTIVFHGDADSTVHPSNGGHVIAATVQAGAKVETLQGESTGGRRYTRELHRLADGTVIAEHWVVHGAPHAWSGGSAAGSYTDPQGPDASAEMVRFFLARRAAA